MGLIEDLGRGPVGLDTAVFIYFIEEHPRFLPLLDPIFSGVDAGQWEAVTSGVTLLVMCGDPCRLAASPPMSTYATPRASRTRRIAAGSNGRASATVSGQCPLAGADERDGAHELIETLGRGQVKVPLDQARPIRIGSVQADPQFEPARGDQPTQGRKGGARLP